jgi:hypothetical protein
MSASLLAEIELERIRRERIARGLTGGPIWKPVPDSPQEQAYRSEADELLYGGAAGGGKTDLLLGLAGTSHRTSVIFRKEFPRIRGIIERSREIFNVEGNTHGKDSYNETLHIWRLGAGRLIEFSSLQRESDVEDQRGRPRDFYGWDELTEFTEFQYRFVNAWNRSTIPNQRCRIVATCNPPSTPEGRWIITYWGAWLDPEHPNPAQPGELRWYAVIDGKDVECKDNSPIFYNGETIYPRSRTFIPARLSDNPFLRDSGYLSMLQGLPEPLRSQMLYGDFNLSLPSDPWQVIPTEWVRLAQERWKQTTPPEDWRLSAIGVDVARGGKDKTVISKRYGTWFAPLLKYAGEDTPDGATTAGLVLKELVGEPLINVDVIGYGSSAYERLADVPHLNVRGVNVGRRSGAYDKSGKLGFTNLRAEIFWKLREALDPITGDGLALPPDSELLSDLCAPRWALQSGSIKVESKDAIKKRIARSPDCGDALALAFYFPANFEGVSDLAEFLAEYTGN